MPDKVNLTYSDYGGEKSTFAFSIQQLNSANLDNTLIAIANLQSAIALVTDGLEVKRTVMTAVSGSGQGSSTNPTAQRELKWLITYKDNVNSKEYQHELPCPTLNANTLSGNPDNDANLSYVDWITFKTNYEAVVKSPDGNAVTLQRVRLVGRNN